MDDCKVKFSDPDEARNKTEPSKTEQNRNILILGAVLFAITFILVLAALLAILLPRSKPAETAGVALGERDRIECPGFENSSAECEENGCIYKPMKVGPVCYMKKDSFGYKLLKTINLPNGKLATLRNKTAMTPYGPSISNVAFEVTYITENIVRAKLYDSVNKRYEVPVQHEFPLLKNRPKVDTQKLVYEVSITNNSDAFGFQVKRTDGTILWDTNIGGLMMSDQYLQLASYLPSTYIYGIGEHTHETFRHDLEYRSWPIFSRDRFPVGGEINGYGVHPYYTCLENTSKSHGVLLLNSNAMEVNLLPEPAISFRTIGGILDFFFVLADSPEHLVQLYTSLIGRPVLPPYWSLGFQLSRYCYDNLENVKIAIERTRKANIAQDVQYLDLDHMDKNKDFTFSQNFSGLTEYIIKTKEEYDLKWIVMIEPGISSEKGYRPYETGVKKDVFVKRSPKWKPEMFPPEVRNDNYIYGFVWPDAWVAFPDYFNPDTKEWWNETIVEYHKLVPFDGLWTDMNEPPSFGTNQEKPVYCTGRETCWSLKCPTSAYDDPPYNPLYRSDSPRLSLHSLCMDSLQTDGINNYTHYDVHNLYGWSQVQPTKIAAESSTGTRSFVLTRSTFPSSGHYAGHWLGDNHSSWYDMRRSIIGMLEFNLFGIPYVGSDLCGFVGNTTEELCYRWSQLGAFYPFFRNHNDVRNVDQDPAVMGKRVAEAARTSTKRRYNLQPYLYTLFYIAHINGSTVVRPLFHEFPFNKHTWNIWEQFMWGSCLLISPILHQGDKSVRLYLPEGEEWWLFNYNKTKAEKPGERYVERGEDLEDIPLHIRGGCIIPTEAYHLRGVKNVKKEIELYVFLRNGEATGELFLDDGISKDTVEKKLYTFYKFTCKNCTFEVRKENDGVYPGEDPTLTLVHFLEMQVSDKGVKTGIATVKINVKLQNVGLYYIESLPFTKCSQNNFYDK